MLLKCSSCGQELTVDDQFAGRQVKCPKCETVLQAPGAGAETPGAAPPPPPAGVSGAGGRLIGKTVAPVVVLLLGIITCGIYSIVWLFLRGGEINGFLGRERVSMGLLVLGIFCWPVTIYNFYVLAKGTSEMREAAGLIPKDNSTLVLVLAILFMPVAPMIVQDDLNSLWAEVTMRSA